MQQTLDTLHDQASVPARIDAFQGLLNVTRAVKDASTELSCLDHFYAPLVDACVRSIELGNTNDSVDPVLLQSALRNLGVLLQFHRWARQLEGAL